MNKKACVVTDATGAPKATTWPNQSMQLTPGRRTIHLYMTTIIHSAATRVLARRS
jgi:hypothetical protein